MIVIGFDGLDYDKIKGYGCNNIQQKHFHRLDLLGLKLRSPVLWATIITGKMPEEHGIKEFQKWSHPAANKASEIIGPLFQKTGHSGLKFMRFLFNFLWGAYPYLPQRKDLKVPSLFEVIPYSKAIMVLSYSEVLTDSDVILQSMGENAVYSKNTAERLITMEFEQRKKEFFEALAQRPPYHLIFMHIWYCDRIPHLYPFDRERDRRLYKEMDNLAGKIIRKVGGQFILFLSDHGMKNGEHVDNAFYSTNFPVEPNLNITELFNLIVEQVKREQKVRGNAL